MQTEIPLQHRRKHQKHDVTEKVKQYLNEERKSLNVLRRDIFTHTLARLDRGDYGPLKRVEILVNAPPPLGSKAARVSGAICRCWAGGAQTDGTRAAHQSRGGAALAWAGQRFSALSSCHRPRRGPAAALLCCGAACLGGLPCKKKTAGSVIIVENCSTALAWPARIASSPQARLGHASALCPPRVRTSGPP